MACRNCHKLYSSVKNLVLINNFTYPQDQSFITYCRESLCYINFYSWC